MSFKSLKRNCFASGENFYNYGVKDRATVDGRVPCPICGKQIQLIARQVGFRKYIPHHHRAAEAK